MRYTRAGRSRYLKVWGPEPAVAGVMHFALACHKWDVIGWTWARYVGKSQFFPNILKSLEPTYYAVQALRKGLS